MMGDDKPWWRTWKGEPPEDSRLGRLGHWLALRRSDRWWGGPASALALVLLQLVRAAARSPYVVRMTPARFIGSLLFDLLILAAAFVGGISLATKRAKAEPKRPEK